jgi:hypothetical protein
MRSLRLASVLAAALVAAAPIASFAAAVHLRPPQTQPSETASQFYLRWRAAALNAKSIDEVTPFWTSDMIGEFNMEPDSAKAGTLPMIKRFYAMQIDVRVVKETATPTGATLALEALDREKKPIVASVDVVKENGAWKMTGAVEQWKAKDGDRPRAGAPDRALASRPS